MLLHAVAGAQWNREGRKNGIPTLARVLAEAEEWMLEEYKREKEAMTAVGTGGGEYAAELRSASHDVLKSGRDRDYRGFALFYQNLFVKNDISIRSFGPRSRDGGGYILTANLFASADSAEATPMIDLLASRHQMRWLKLCEDTLSSDRQTRRRDFQDRFRQFTVSVWEEKLKSGRVDGKRIMTLNPCRFCKVCAKTSHAPETFYGTGTEKVDWNQVACQRDEPYSCGTMERVFDYPILNMGRKSLGRRARSQVTI